MDGISAFAFLGLIISLIGYVAICLSEGAMRTHRLSSDDDLKGSLKQVLTKSSQYRLLFSYLRATLRILALLAMVVLVRNIYDSVWAFAIATILLLSILPIFRIFSVRSARGFSLLILRVLAPIFAILERVLRPVLNIFHGKIEFGSTLTISGNDAARGVVEEGGNGTQLLQEGEEVGEQERKMIQGILSLEDVTAREVMVPRVDMVASEASALLPIVSALMSEGGHSRIPIYEETIDTVVGIVHARDLLKYLSAEDTAANLTVREIARSPVFIPDSKPLDELLQEFQEQHVTIAVVVDEYGGTEGLITMEDMVEEIVGEIEDEFQREEPTVSWVSDSEVVMDARVSLDEVNDSLETSLEGDGFDTLGGLLYARFGKIPASGEEVTLDGLRMQVLSTSGRRIRKVRILLNP